MRWNVTPVATRWNSDYDSIACAVSQDAAKLVSVMIQLNLDPLHERDRHNLIEYLAIMRPLSVILYELQKDDSNYLGCALPCIINIKAMMYEVRNLSPLGLGVLIREGLFEHIDRR